MYHYNIKSPYMKVKFIGNDTENFLSHVLSYVIFIMQLLNRFIIFIYGSQYKVYITF